MSAAKGLLVTLAALGLLAVLALTTLFLTEVHVPGGALAAWASQRIGRPLVIDGPVSLGAGQTVTFRAEGVRLANAPWGSRDDMLAIARLTVEVDAWSLVRRPVIVRRVEVEGLDLLLERTRSGDNNWQFGADDTDEPFTWPESLPVVVERVSLPGARLGFIGPRLERPLELRFERLEQSRGSGGMLELAGAGLANATELVLQVRAGPFPRLVEGRDFSVSIDAQLGEIMLEGRLHVDDIARPVATTLSLKVRGPDADYLASRFGIRNLGAGPFSLDAAVRPAASEGGIEGEITGTVGQFSVEARGELVEPMQMGRARLRLEIAGPDLSFAGGLAGIERLPAEPFRLEAALERSGEVLRINEATLALADSRAELGGTISDFSAMTGNDLRFRFQGEDLTRFQTALSLPESVTGPFDLAGRIRGDGDAERIELQATTTLGKLDAAGALGRYPDYHGTRVRIDASGPSLARVGELAGIAVLPGSDFAASGDFEWTAAGTVIRGGTLRAGRDQFGIDGRIARDPLGRGTDVAWTARGPDLRQLATAFGAPGVVSGAFDLGGRLRREPKASRLDKVHGTVAGAAVTFSGRVADTPRRGTNVEFSVEGPRLEAFAGLSPKYSLPPGKFRVAGGLILTTEQVTLRQLRFSAAGAEGTADADIVLPLGAVRGRFSVAARGADLAPFLPQLGKARRDTGPFELVLRGAADGRSWSFDDARLTASAGSITASGRLDWAPDFSATALNVEVRAQDLSAAGRLFGRELPAQPFELTAEFTGTPTTFRVERASGKLGTSDFDGRMELDLRARPVMDLDFRSDFLDLTPFMDAPAPASSPAPAPLPKDERLIPDSAIPLAWLNRVDGSLDIRATRALVADFALDDLRIAARLQGGALSVDSLELSAPPDGRLTLSGELVPGARGAALRISASGTRVSLADPRDTPAQRAARPRGEIRLELAGEGATWSELARSFDGHLRVTTGVGSFPTTRLNVLFGNLLRDIAARLVPGSAPSATADLRCMAAFATVTDGVIRTAPALVVQTDRINLASQGSVDLRTEQVEFYLRTAPRRGRIGISVAEIVNPYLVVNGPLARPGVAVDPKGALFSGGAAVATAGISILAKGVWDRVFQADDPCAAAAAEADRLAKKAAGPPKKSVLEKLRGG